jgi:thioesterase domain-containing protein
VFEIARQFQQLKRFPDLVVLFDCRVPITTPAMAALDPALMKASILFERADRASQNSFALEELVNLTLDEQLALVSERAGIAVDNLIPKEIGRNRLQRYLDIRIARNRAIENYVLRPYYGKVVLYRAASLGPPAQIPVMQEIFERAAETPDYYWGQFCPGGLETITVPGDHDTLLAPPYVEHLARNLADRLQRYTGSASGC